MLLCLFLFSCTRQKQQGYNKAQLPKVVEAKGYVVPKDSMAEPHVILVDESKLKKIPVGNPKVVLTNTNVHPAGRGKVIPVDEAKLLKITPGTDKYSVPKTVPAIDSPFVAGIPEVVAVKEPYIKDQNPQNFSSLSKLQGLKHDAVRCILQDRAGNLWFGTEGGGVSKYDGQSFAHFTDKEGLSDNNVWCILEDRSGHLWFGTGGGISKYDGKSFTHFKGKQGPSNRAVWSISEDRAGNLWFGISGGGVSKYDGQSFTHFTAREGLTDHAVLKILEDRSGNLWFGTYGDGIVKYDGEYFTHFTNKKGHNYDINTVLSILEDKAGNLWFGTEGNGVLKYDGQSFTHFTDKEGLSHNVVFSISEDRSGNLWFGTFGGGVSKYDGQSFTHFTDKEGLSSNVVLGILEDRSGNLWFGTYGGGVSRYGGQSFTHFTDQEGLSNNTVWSILEDRVGNLWYGTAGGGVLKYDGQSFTHFTDKEGLSSNVVLSILEDRSGNFWFGTQGGGVSKYTRSTERNYEKGFFTHFTVKEGLSSNVVRSILEDRSGNLWFNTQGSGVSKYDGKSFTHFTVKEGLSHNLVMSISEDRSGNIWFGTYGGGVSKYDGTSFTHFTDKEGLSNNFVTSILEDRMGNLWFGTYGGGVSKYDGKSFTHFTDKEGLSNNFVFSIVEDISVAQGGIWFGTRFGLNRIASEKLVPLRQTQNNDLRFTEEDVIFKSYGYEDGFLGIGCNSGSICRSKDGNIWIGANEKLTVCHPEGLVPDTMPPNIQLTGLDLFNEPIAWPQLSSKQDSILLLKNGMQVAGYSFSDVSHWYSLPENLSLAYNNNYLTFNFIGITMSQPKKVKYQYKLEGMDENWSGLTLRNEATYGNIPSGTYTFLVKAMNSEGVWSKPFQYTFTIRPPWWKTWWAYSLYLFFGIFSVSGYLRWRDRMALLRRKILEQKVSEATVEVLNQRDLLKKQKEEVINQKEEAEKQKRRSDELLLNILPFEVAEELKMKGESKAKNFDEATVLFTDFKDFTSISERMSAEELVAELHHCFSAFDKIMLKHGLEKIKTIGDSYMAVAGVPDTSEESAVDAVRAGLAITRFISGYNESRKQLGKDTFEIRVGVHTGPLIAGIVGIKKFQYDIWGDTVNIASRMESNGAVGRVNISSTTYEIVKPYFHCEHRGGIEVKGKGNLDMYFVLDKKKSMVS